MCRIGKMNLNTIFNKFVNFKIGFTNNPSPIQIGNKDLVFVIENRFRLFNREGRIYDHRTFLYFKRIEWNKDTDIVEIILE
jgi:hypothetical protein